MSASIDGPLSTNSDAGVGFCLRKDAGAKRIVDTNLRSQGLALSKPLAARKTACECTTPILCARVGVPIRLSQSRSKVTVRFTNPGKVIWPGPVAGGVYG